MISLFQKIFCKNTKGQDQIESSSSKRKGNFLFGITGRTKRTKRQKKSSRAKSSMTDECRRDKRAALGASIGETYASLRQENPDALEADALRRAIELSMLDWALVVKRSVPGHAPEQPTHRRPTPHQILGLSKSSSPAQIKAAYRRKARETHPDKGGKPGDFELVARAYRMLLHGHGDDTTIKEQQSQRIIKCVDDLDAELRDHQMLVNELFENHGTDLSSIVSKLNTALDELGLYPKDAGATNLNEKKEKIRNSCFYLSLAASYLHGIGALLPEENQMDKDNNQALIGETALDLKRTIEAAVVHVHPEWAAQGKVGEEVQAFSDFLVYVLDSPTILSDWAVTVFDTVSGFVDVYKGKDYREEDKNSARSNSICLRYVPGHYQPMYPISTRPSLDKILECLDSNEVFYVITDG